MNLSSASNARSTQGFSSQGRPIGAGEAGKIPTAPSIFNRLAVKTFGNHQVSFWTELSQRRRPIRNLIDTPKFTQSTSLNRRFDVTGTSCWFWQRFRHPSSAVDIGPPKGAWTPKGGSEHSFGKTMSSFLAGKIAGLNSSAFSSKESANGDESSRPRLPQQPARIKAQPASPASAPTEPARPPSRGR